MAAIISKGIFSARWSFVIFVAYICFGMGQGLLITASKASDNAHYDYNTITVVMLVNVAKLMLSSAMFVRDFVNDDPAFSYLTSSSPQSAKRRRTNSNNNIIIINNNNNNNDKHIESGLCCCSSSSGSSSGSSISSITGSISNSIRNNCLSVYFVGFRLLFREISKNRRLMFYFFIPAAMYTTYDNLMFVSLSVFTPTTYTILAQCRIVITAVVFERLFRRRLSAIQWMSLFFLTLGCVVKELFNVIDQGLLHPETKMMLMDKNGAVEEQQQQQPQQQQPQQQQHMMTHEYLLALGCVGIQIICSCFANVYTEFLFKDKDTRAHPMVENVFMYCNNIACSLIVLLYRGQLGGVFSSTSLHSVLQTFVIAIIVNQAVFGLVTATFLRKLNSIVKSFATAIELVFTPFVCWFLFGHQVDLSTVVALCIVCAASCVYASNPVHVTVKASNVNNINSSSSSNSNNDPNSNIIGNDKSVGIS